MLWFEISLKQSCCFLYFYFRYFFSHLQNFHYWVGKKRKCKKILIYKISNTEFILHFILKLKYTIYKICYSNPIILHIWLAVMLFNQMSNSTGLRYTSQPMNHCVKNMYSHTCTNMLIHTSKTKHTPKAFAKPAEILRQCWASPETAFSLLYVCMCVCVLMCEVKRKEKKSSLHVLFMCLSFIRCLLYISLETFSHFKSSLAISEIIGLVLSRLHVQHFPFFLLFFLSACNQAAKSQALSFPFLLLTMCQHVHVSQQH